MSDLSAPVGDSAPAPAITPAEAPSLSEAAAALSQRRWEKVRQAQQAPAEVEPQPELAEAPTDDPEPAPVEATEQQPEPAEEPPIEPPRSWTKEEKEEFATYPREAQEKIARREQERETALRRSQNEAAEKLKGLTAKEQEAEQVRQRYEQALPALLQTLQEQQQGEFADIRTMADVERLAREDWPRYALWDAQQKKIAAVTQEVRSSQERQTHEFRQKWSEFASKQDQLLVERAPELADKAKAAKIAETAKAVLTDIGFNDQELAQAWNGEASVSLRDARIQLLILDAVKYRDAKANLAKPAPKPVTQVQKPGVAEPRSAALAVQNLSKKLEQTGRLEDALAVVQARRASRR